MKVTYEDLKSIINSFKSSKKVFYTNSFSLNENAESFRFIKNDCGIFFQEYDSLYDVFKSYYLVSNLECLAKLLNEFHIKENSSLELVTNNEIELTAVQQFNQAGFKKYTTLQKMSFLESERTNGSLEPEVDFCKATDLAFFLDIFNKNFDRYSERLPSENDILIAINNRNILSLREYSGNIIGFLWFDHKKVVTELRYLFVSESSRGLGLSKKLMNAYLHFTNHIKKKQLWVLTDNPTAINLYKTFGYEFEKTHNTVFKYFH